MKLKPKIISIALTGTLALGTATTAGAVSSDRFNDVKATDWYYSAVNHVVDHNYFNGVGANTFAPNQSLNRAMAVTVLARMFGGDLSGYNGKTAFTDVPSDAYYAKAVQWAVDKGIASGTSPATFSPDAYATREQISVFLYNAVRAFGDLGSFNGTVLNTFSDKDQVSSWAKIALQWATSNKVINGDGGQVKPQNSTTRAAFATIAMNYDNKYQGGTTTPDPTPTPDPDPAPTPDPAPKPDPTPDPSPGDDESVTSKEDEINSLLVASWGSSNSPTRDTNKLVQAARKIASGETTDVEQALKSVGFDKPVGTIYRDKYVYDRYEAKSFLVTASSVTQAVNSLKKNDSLADPSSYTDYGIGVYQMNAIQFRVSVVTYDGDCYTNADTTQMMKDWLAEQANLPVALSDMEQQVLDLTNQERAQNGLAPLKVTAETQEAARIRASELPIKLTSNHTRPDGRMYHTVLYDIGSAIAYKINGDEQHAGCTGENIGWGCTTPSEILAGWMSSTGHRRNILDPRFTHIGISVIPRYENGKQAGYYWEQFFLGIDP